MMQSSPTRADLENRAHELAAKHTAARQAWSNAQTEAKVFAAYLVEKHGWSQRDAAAHCGIDRRALNRGLRSAGRIVAAHRERASSVSDNQVQ